MRYAILLLGLIIISCNAHQKPEKMELSQDHLTEIRIIKTIPPEEGLALVSENCYACHQIDSESHDNMLAPPLARIKYTYKKKFDSEELFIAKMSDFLIEPTKQKAIMKGPVRRFGLMPVTGLSNEEIKELTKYIYHNELEYPEWFPAHFEEEHHIKWEDRNTE